MEEEEFQKSSMKSPNERRSSRKSGNSPNCDVTMSLHGVHVTSRDGGGNVTSRQDSEEEIADDDFDIFEELC